jgi:AraC-like DNA-binding protein
MLASERRRTMLMAIRYLDKTMIRPPPSGSAVLAAGSDEHAATHRFARGAGFAYLTAALIRRGRVAFTREEELRTVVPGPALVAIEPGTPYAIASADGRGWSELWLILRERPQWRGLLAGWPMPLPGLRVLPLPSDASGADVAQAIEMAGRDHGSAHPERQALVINAWERALLLARAVAGEGERLHGAVRAALAAAALRPLERHSVASLAREVGLSPSHLAALVRKDLGVSLMRHLRQRRLERARELLVGTDWPVARVAAAVGFADPFHFSARFHAEVGCSPRDYRRSLRGAASGLSN